MSAAVWSGWWHTVARYIRFWVKTSESRLLKAIRGQEDIHVFSFSLLVFFAWYFGFFRYWNFHGFLPPLKVPEVDATKHDYQWLPSLPWLMDVPVLQLLEICGSSKLCYPAMAIFLFRAGWNMWTPQQRRLLLDCQLQCICWWTFWL